MHRDHSPIGHCRECGQVTRMLVFETGLDEEGSEYRAIRGETVPHTLRDCASFQALQRETWPTLW